MQEKQEKKSVFSKKLIFSNYGKEKDNRKVYRYS